MIDYDAQTELTTAELAAEAETIPSVRLVDPAVVSQTFQQLQQVRGFYQFPQVLEVDRYTTSEGETVDTIVAARELDGPPSQEDRWLTRHLVYTHGFGMVAAAGNQVDSEGRPVFLEYNIPPTGELSQTGEGYEPRIYFGREGAEYVIVNAEAEYDYPVDPDTPEVPTTEDAVVPTPSPSPEADEAPAPADSREEGSAQEQQDQEGQDGGEDAQGTEEEQSGQGSGQANNYYDGKGGVQLKSFFDKLMYALKYQEINILLNNAISNESQIIYVRDPAERVEKVAPFLTVDGKAYPAVVDGRIVWIVDAYTTSDRYPYSTPIDLAQATTDTFTESTTAVNALPGNRVNYIRNSVKATVDAYDGTVTLYAWDEDDPVLRTWQKAFGGAIIKPRSEISPELKSHLRYPTDLYKVQREILERYHHQRRRLLRRPGLLDRAQRPEAAGGQQPGAALPPDHPLPGRRHADVLADVDLRAQGRENLAAFMAVNSDASSEDYGQMRILELPRSTAVKGRGRSRTPSSPRLRCVKCCSPWSRARRSPTATCSPCLSLAVCSMWDRSTCRPGQRRLYPLLQQVLVGFGDQVAIGSNLQEALNNLFDGDEAPLRSPPQTEGPGGRGAAAGEQRPRPGAGGRRGSVRRGSGSAAGRRLRRLRRGQRAVEGGPRPREGRIRKQRGEGRVAGCRAAEAGVPREYVRHPGCCHQRQQKAV